MYRCLIGHEVAESDLPTLQDNAIDRALDAALRALREKAVTSRSLAERLDDTWSGRRARHRATVADDQADVMEQLIARVHSARERQEPGSAESTG